jgi:hypothetical protein
MGKTSYALGRVNKKSPNYNPEGRKTWYCEFDPGSYDRAAGGLNIDEKRIVVNKYKTPLSSLLDFGKLSTATTGNSGKGAVQIVHRLSGWLEEYWRFVSEFAEAMQTGDYDTAVEDTVAREWVMAQNAFKQRIQDETDVDRERLTRLEYQEPNGQQYQLRDAAIDNGADYVLITHEGEVWKKNPATNQNEPTGQPKPDGWNDAMKIADITLRFTLRPLSGKLTPVASVFKMGGADLSMIGREFITPNLDSISHIMNAASLLRREGIPIPLDNDELLETAKTLMETE